MPIGVDIEMDMNNGVPPISTNIGVHHEKQRQSLIARHPRMTTKQIRHAQYTFVRQGKVYALKLDTVYFTFFGNNRCAGLRFPYASKP